jgi:hypothetical protein
MNDNGMMKDAAHEMTLGRSEVGEHGRFGIISVASNWGNGE